MKAVEPEEQARLLAVLKKHKKRLLRYPGVHHVDVGYVYKRGRPTGTLGIRVHVRKKRPKSQLARREVLPKEIAGVTVDVLETNPQPQLVNRTAKQNPLLAGVEIRNTRLSGAGTLGAIVFDRDTLEPMGLSNAHVLVKNSGQQGDVVNQPGTTRASDRVGQLNRWSKFYDCAVFRLDVPGLRPFTLKVADVPNPETITGLTAALLGTRVMKSGRTTLTTVGIVDGVDNVFEFTVVPDPANMPAGGQITDFGDSGAVWLEANSHRAVGLNYAGERAGEPERAWAKYIGAVLDKLDVFFFDTAAVSRVYISWMASALGQTRPNAPCHLKITYPSGRVSTAKGLGAKTADARGWVRWHWRVGTDTRRRDPTTGLAEFRLDGRVVQVRFLPERMRVITP